MKEKQLIRKLKRLMQMQEIIDNYKKEMYGVWYKVLEGKEL